MSVYTAKTKATMVARVNIPVSNPFVSPKNKFLTARDELLFFFLVFRVWWFFVSVLVLVSR